jgi:hypothetical protein
VERPPIWGVAVNILNEQLLTADIVLSSGWGLGEVLTTVYSKTGFVTKHEHLPRSWIHTLV